MLSEPLYPQNISEEEKSFRCMALQEELDEYEEADTLVDQYDALLDLIVFAVGTLERHGFPLQEGFNAVMKANMTKEVGANAKRGNFKNDLVKPISWRSPEPELQKILTQQLMRYEKMRENDGHLLETQEELQQSVQTEIGFVYDVKASSDSKETMKDDSNKVPLDLLPIEPLFHAAEVLAFGAKKYEANSWRDKSKSRVKWSRTYGSVMRHLMLFWKGEDIDSESGLPHIYMALTQLMFLAYDFEFFQEADDRHKSTK
jgi:hypothetical protein